MKKALERFKNSLPIFEDTHDFYNDPKAKEFMRKFTNLLIDYIDLNPIDLPKAVLFTFSNFYLHLPKKFTQGEKGQYAIVHPRIYKMIKDTFGSLLHTIGWWEIQKED